MSRPPRRDQFRDVGRHFHEGEWAELPVDGSRIGTDYTVKGWFIWLSGPGPLLATRDAAFSFVYDQAGECAYRVGDHERVTVVPTRAARDHWVYLAIAKAGPSVILRFNDAVADRWDSAEKRLSNRAARQTRANARAHPDSRSSRS
jgi:hypothetical protein